MNASLILLGIAVALGAPAAAAQTPDGQALYREHCRTCHGVTGQPTRLALKKYPKIPTLSDSAFIAGVSQDSIIAVLTHGAGNGEEMKSFRDKLTRDEMTAVARYVRSLSARPRTP